MTTAFSSELLEQMPIVGILRGLPPDKLRPVVEAIRDGGLTNLEVTMNTPGAAEQIRAARDLAGGSLNVGAGTVTDLGRLEEALAAGASFIVTPTLSEPVIHRCIQLGVPVFPGALSPGEVMRAWEVGATMVKVFPADAYGPEYLARLKGLSPDLRLMPTGGVDVTTLESYARAGADAFGVGSPLFRAERIAAADWDWVREQARAFANAYRKIKQQL
jgi:2-dehydro-3-deoxyphosphogluconate aldolase/(4S)-4-hydroxy-2-oxoglutarate aldolase